MLERVKTFIQENQMIRPGDRVVAGISGGADSVCLFFLLLKLSGEMGFSLYAVHVNHCLRGAESDGDEAFVRELCGREGVPLRVFSFDVGERAAREKLSCEEAGRLCRYEAFREEAARLGGARIAVAHHANDQAETVLFHLFRGSGIRGLAGMEPVSGDVIRPLLREERSEIQKWLSGEGHEWRTDSSNESPDYTRNRIRNGILAEAEQEINARAVRHVAQAAQELLETERFLSRKTEEAFRLCVRAEEDGCFVFEAGLRTLDPLLQGRLIRRCLEECGGMRDVDRVHIEMALSLLEKQTGSRLDLPGRRGVRREYQGLWIFRRPGPAGAGAGETPERESCEQALRPEIPGTCRIGGQTWSFSLENAQKDQIIPEKTYTKWFDYDKIKKYLEIRGRKPGDFLEINREHGRKKLKAYLTDEKVPVSERERLRLLADGAHILWVPGRRISEGYKVTADTERILKVQIDGGEENG